MTLPEGFLWGAATSSHQVEGGNDGNDWWDWEQRPGHIHDGTVSGDAAGWWAGRAEEDLRHAASLGHNAHRLSLEWSRIEPEPGRFDEGALERYSQILSAARDAGLTPVVTLHHFTLPRWAAERGGWLSGELPERFARYAHRCVRRLGELAPLWATLNEPSVLAHQAYAGREWPPGRGSPQAGFVALSHMLRAHTLGFEAAHRAQPDARMGIVLNLPLFEPDRPGSLRDRAVARAQDWAFNGAVLEGLSSGRLLPPLAVPSAHAGSLARSFDFVGLNYYGRFAVRFDARRASEAFGRHVQRPTTRTEHTDWGQPCPRGLTEQLMRLSELGVPLYVTENGLYDNTDEHRPRFIVEHVRAVQDAVRRGADVRGYFHWSLVDNFEWAEGWATRFGLLALDRETGRRTPRESAEVYARICRESGVPEDLEV